MGKPIQSGHNTRRIKSHLFQSPPFIWGRFFYTTNLNFLFSKIPQKIIIEIENIIDFKRPIPPLDISSGHLKPNNAIIGYTK